MPRNGGKRPRKCASGFIRSTVARTGDTQAMPTTRTTRLEPRALLRERLIDGVAVSPDGGRVAYSERTVADGPDRPSMWIVPFGAGRARRLTHGAWTDSRPRFSPDGRTLAFLSTREGKDD